MDIEKLEIAVRWSKRILVGVIIVVIGVYVVTFGAHPAGGPDTWGQFGDYLGGVMNPLIAFDAFYWVATSVILQKQELAETKAALVASQLAQQDQAETALHTTKIQTLNIRLQSVSTRLSQVRHQMAELQHYLGQFGSARIYYNEYGDESSPGAVLDDYRFRSTSLAEKENTLVDEIEALSQEFFDKRQKRLANQARA